MILPFHWLYAWFVFIDLTSFCQRTLWFASERAVLAGARSTDPEMCDKIIIFGQIPLRTSNMRIRPWDPRSSLLPPPACSTLPQFHCLVPFDLFLFSYSSSFFSSLFFLSAPSFNFLSRRPLLRTTILTQSFWMIFAFSFAKLFRAYLLTNRRQEAEGKKCPPLISLKEQNRINRTEKNYVRIWTFFFFNKLEAVLTLGHRVPYRPVERLQRQLWHLALPLSCHRERNSP